MPDSLPDPVTQRSAILRQLAASPSDADANTMNQLPPLADAQPLTKATNGVGKLAPLMYLGGAAADMGTTAYFNAHPELHIHEANPLINWAPKGAQLPLGAAMEAGTIYAGSKLLRNHPTLMKALLMGAGALHGGLALSNLNLIHNADQAK